MRNKKIKGWALSDSKKRIMTYEEDTWYFIRKRKPPKELRKICIPVEIKLLSPNKKI